MAYKQAIQRLLVTTAASAGFPEATYSADRPSLLTEGDDVQAASVEANEIRAVFGIDDRYQRSFRQDRQGWAWLLNLRFDSEVVLEEYEQGLLESPLVIGRDPSSGVDRQVRLLLEDALYEHPPRGGASNGTSVTYRFVAELCPQ